MEISLLLHFTNHQLAIKDYQIDMQRQSDQLHISVTNMNTDLAFIVIYDHILELLGDDKDFAVEVISEARTATFTHMTADYYLNNMAEVLHFGKAEIKQENRQEQEEAEAEQENR